MSDPSQQKRTFERETRRIPCELRAEGSDYAGFILDISARGLFVQTTAAPPEGSQVKVRLHDMDDAEIEVVARVARRRKSLRQLASLEAGGLGLRLESAPEEFFRFVLEIGGDPQGKDEN